MEMTLNQSTDPLLSPATVDQLMLAHDETTSAMIGAFTELPVKPSLPFLQNVVRLITVYCTPLLFGLGCLGNTFCILILSRGPLIKRASSHHLIGLCSAESLHLFYHFHRWLNDFIVSLYHFGGWCQFVTLVDHVADFLSIWYMVSYSVERYIAYCWPAQHKMLCSMTKTKCCLVALVVIGIVVYINISIMFGVIAYNNSVMCFPLREYRLHLRSLKVAGVLMNSCIPQMSILALFVLSVCHLYKKPRRSAAGSSLSGSTRARDPEGQRRLSKRGTYEPAASAEDQLPEESISQTGVWVTLTVVYLLLTTEEEMVRVYNTMHSFATNRETKLMEFLWEQLFLYLKHTKYCLNIVIFLCSYRAFRRESCKFMKHCVSCVFKKHACFRHDLTEDDRVVQESV